MGGSDIEKREQWGDTKFLGISVEFMLSCIGYAVGLGNVWGFPYRMSQSGGGAFLIPYCIFLFFCGIPLVMLELTIGQYSAKGPLTVWTHIPIFKGIGLAMLFTSWIVTIYYNVIVAWAIHYLFSCFQTVLPWTRCDQAWNTPSCAGQFQTRNFSEVASYNLTAITLPAEEYWINHLQRENVFAETGNWLFDGVGISINWQLFLANLFAWILVFFCLIKGIQSSGKVVYFTATFPYVILLILFFNGIWRPGAGNGIKAYLGIGDPTLLDNLKSSKTWSQAAIQIFFSLGVGFGGLLTMGSYNKFSNNIARDSMLLCCINCGTSFFAGFVIFSIIGNMGFLIGKESIGDLKALTKGGNAGLAFIAYPQALGNMPGSHFWSICFFFMLILLGLDSQYAMCETVITGLTDKFPHLRAQKQWVLLIYCVINFLLSFTMMTPAGTKWFEVLFYYSAWHGFLLFILVGWLGTWVLYGNVVPAIAGDVSWSSLIPFTSKPGSGSRLMEDVRKMIGPETSCYRIFFKYYMELCWWFGTPILLGYAVIYSLINFEDEGGPADYGNKGIQAIANIMNWAPPVLVIGYAIYEIVKKGLWASVQPEKSWLPQESNSESHHGKTNMALE